MVVWSVLLNNANQGKSTMADYFESGFTVREPAWHGKGNVLDAHPENWDEARMAAGLMWEPQAEPLYRLLPSGEYEQVGSTKLITRDDSGKELGAVGSSFELISHAEMGDMLEAVLEQPNVKFETAGSVREGRQVYALVLLDEPYQITGDTDGFGDPVLTLPYFALLNSHDGTGACKGLYTQVRVVCANTVQAASMDGDRHGHQFSLRHTSGVKSRIEEAKAVIRGARDEAARWRELAEHLAALSVDHEGQMQFLDEFLPVPPVGFVSDRVRGNVETDRGRFLHVLRSSATNSEQAGNALGLVNAAVEYLDHLRGFRNRDTYLGRQLLYAEPLKAKAVRIAQKVAAPV
jgi:phage/plasmid-like protein (TIGR03299 family)